MNDRAVNAYSSANEVLVSVNPAAGVWLPQYLQALHSGDPVNFETVSGKPGSDS